MRAERSRFAVEAVRLAGLGWPVFPQNGKRPLTPRGFKDATLDRAEIAAWGKRFPTASIGIATGERSGTVVLDVDDGGRAALRRLERRHGVLPKTPRARTPSGGLHIYFAHPDRHVRTLAPGVLAPGLELKADNACITAPCGAGRRWLVSPWETPLAELPAWLTEKARNGQVTGRNVSLHRLATKLWKRGSGLTEDELRSLVYTLRDAKFAGLPDSEVESMLRQVRTYERELGERELVVTSASEVRMRRMRHLVPLVLPLGSLSMLVGRQGTGKSTLAAQWVAGATRGRLGGDVQRPVNCAMVSYEDNAETLLVPRLKAAGANLRRVKIISAQRDGQRDLVSLPDDVHRLREVVRQHRIRFLTLDPVVAGMGGAVDTHRDSSVRGVLAPLAQLAEDEDVVILGLIHFTKDGAADALARTSGSLAFTAAPRSVLAFAYDPEEDDQQRSPNRVLAHAKSNVGPLAPSSLYQVMVAAVRGDGSERIETSKVVYIGEHTADADSLLVRRDADAAATSEFLKELLVSRARPVKEIQAEAASASLEWKEVLRAKRALRVRSRKAPGFGDAGGWEWHLPPPKDGQ